MSGAAAQTMEVTERVVSKTPEERLARHAGRPAGTSMRRLLGWACRAPPLPRRGRRRRVQAQRAARLLLPTPLRPHAACPAGLFGPPFNGTFVEVAPVSSSNHMGFVWLPPQQPGRYWVTSQAPGACEAGKRPARPLGTRGSSGIQPASCPGAISWLLA